MPNRARGAHVESVADEEAMADRRRFSPRLRDRPWPAVGTAQNSASAADTVNIGSGTDQAAASPTLETATSGPARKRQRTSSLPPPSSAVVAASANGNGDAAESQAVPGCSTSPRRRRSLRLPLGSSPGKSSATATLGSIASTSSGSSKAASSHVAASAASPSSPAATGAVVLPRARGSGKVRKDMRGRPPLVKPDEIAVLLWYKHGRYPYWPGLVKQSVKDKSKVVVTFPGWGRAEKEGVIVTKDWLRRHCKDFHGAMHEDLVAAGFASPYHKQFFFAMRKSKYMTDSLRLDTTLAQFLSRTEGVSGDLATDGDQRDHDDAEPASGDSSLLNEYDDTVAPDGCESLQLNGDSAANTSQASDLTEADAESNHAQPQDPAAVSPGEIMSYDGGGVDGKEQDISSEYPERVDITLVCHAVKPEDAACADPVPKESSIPGCSESVDINDATYCRDDSALLANETPGIVCTAEVSCVNNAKPSGDSSVLPCEPLVGAGAQVKEAQVVTSDSAMRSCSAVDAVEVIPFFSAPEELDVTSAVCETPGEAERELLIHDNVETSPEPCDVACLVEVSSAGDLGPDDGCTMTNVADVPSNEAGACQPASELTIAKMESTAVQTGYDIEPGSGMLGRVGEQELDNCLPTGDPKCTAVLQPNAEVDQLAAIGPANGLADCNEQSNVWEANLATRSTENPTKASAGVDACGSFTDKMAAEGAGLPEDALGLCETATCATNLVHSSSEMLADAATSPIITNGDVSSTNGELPSGFDGSNTESVPKVFAGCDGDSTKVEDTSAELPSGFDGSNTESVPKVLAGCDGDSTKMEDTSAGCLEPAHRPTSMVITDGLVDDNIVLAGESACPVADSLSLKVGLPLCSDMDGIAATNYIGPHIELPSAGKPMDATLLHEHNKANHLHVTTSLAGDASADPSAYMTNQQAHNTTVASQEQATAMETDDDSLSRSNADSDSHATGICIPATMRTVS